MDVFTDQPHVCRSSKTALSHHARGTFHFRFLLVQSIERNVQNDLTPPTFPPQKLSANLSFIGKKI